VAYPVTGLGGVSAPEHAQTNRWTAQPCMPYLGRSQPADGYATDPTTAEDKAITYLSPA